MLLAQRLCSIGISSIPAVPPRASHQSNVTA
jgi:hypothetical protein